MCKEVATRLLHPRFTGAATAEKNEGALHRLEWAVVRSISALALVAGVVCAAATLAEPHADLVLATLAALLLAVTGRWQIRVGRPHAVGLLAVVAVEIALSLPWAEPVVADALQAALVVVAMVGVLLLDEPKGIRLIIAVGVAWATGVLLRPDRLFAVPSSMAAVAILVALGIFGTLTVRLAKRQILLSESRYRLLFEESPLGIAVATASGKLIEVNDALVRMYGFPDRETMLSVDASELWVDPARRKLLVASVMENTNVDGFEGHVRRFDGSEFWIRVHGVYDAADGRVRLISRDVTAERAAEKALRDLVAEKDRFIAGVSHELRTPLAAVVGFASELRDHIDELAVGPAREMAGLVVEQSIELTAIVEDLLVAARLEIGELTIRPEPTDLAFEASRSTPVAADSPIPIRGNGQAWADPLRVRQILRNLISNAVKYGGPNIDVEIVPDTTTATVRVSDDGPGVPPGARDEIFVPYWTTAHVSGYAQSLGLGLTVAKALAEAMRGDLVYRRNHGRTTFELTLPTFGAPAA